MLCDRKGIEIVEAEICPDHDIKGKNTLIHPQVKSKTI